MILYLSISKSAPADDKWLCMYADLSLQSLSVLDLQSLYKQTHTSWLLCMELTTHHIDSHSWWLLQYKAVHDFNLCACTYQWSAGSTWHGGHSEVKSPWGRWTLRPTLGTSISEHATKQTDMHNNFNDRHGSHGNAIIGNSRHITSVNSTPSEENIQRHK